MRPPCAPPAYSKHAAARLVRELPFHSDPKARWHGPVALNNQRGEDNPSTICRAAREKPYKYDSQGGFTDMKNKLTGLQPRSEDGYRGAETGSAALNTPNSANRTPRAINTEGSGAGLALATSATRRKTPAAGIRQQEKPGHRSAVSSGPSRWPRSRNSAVALDKVTGAGSDKPIGDTDMPESEALARITGGVVPGSGSRRVAGVDSVPMREGGGWVMAVTETDSGAPVEFSVWESFADLWGFACERGLLVVAVDMPVGLPGAGGRTADRDGRGFLKPKRTSCVFAAPALCILDVENYDLAKRLSYDATSKMPTKQAHALLPKIRQVRHAVNDPNSFYRCGSSIDSAPTWAIEVHPEVSFAKLAGEPIPVSKHTRAGVARRVDVLQAVFHNIAEAMTAPVAGGPRPRRDDRLDAAAAAWTARQLVNGDADCLGAGEDDATGYPMNIWV